MGDSSTRATGRWSAAAVRKAMAAPIERPQSTGWKGTAGSIRAIRSARGIEPDLDIARLAAAERRIRSLALAVTSRIERRRRSSRAGSRRPRVVPRAPVEVSANP